MAIFHLRCLLFIFCVSISKSNDEWMFRREAVIEKNYVSEISLNPLYRIDGNSELSHRISVQKEDIIIDGTASNTVLRVFSESEDREYSAGDSISINIEFGTNISLFPVLDVSVELPTLELNTGCNEAECLVAGIQKFECRATSGKFALSFNGDTIANIDSTSSKYRMKEVLHSFRDVRSASIQFEKEADTVCSDVGTVSVVTFEEVEWDNILTETLPLLQFDYLNAPVEVDSLKSWGDGTRLCFGYRCDIRRNLYGTDIGKYHIWGDERIGDPSFSGVILPSVAEEIVQGRRKKNAVATYKSGNNSKVLEFSYQVEEWDLSDRLDYFSSNALKLGSYYATNVNLELPDPKTPFSYHSSRGTSLSFNRKIVVNNGSPQVNNVSAVSPQGIYGVGDTLILRVAYNQPIYADFFLGMPKLILETGLIDHTADCMYADDNSLIFSYVVKNGDSTSKLDYKSRSSLNLNGAKVYRNSSTPTILVDTTLPNPGHENSLSSTSDISIRPYAINALGVTTNSTNGTYGAGDVIFISVHFGWWSDELVPVKFIGPVTNVALELHVGTVPSSYIFEARLGNSMITLSNGHNMRTADIGRRFTNANCTYTLMSIFQNNSAVLEPQWMGPNVQYGSPLNQVIDVDTSTNTTYIRVLILSDMNRLNKLNFGTTFISLTKYVFSKLSSDGTRLAYFANGNGTSSITFKYTVQQDDISSNLDYRSSGSFLIPEETLLLRNSSLSLQPLSVSLPPPGDCLALKGCSLSANYDIRIDTVQPEILLVFSLKEERHNGYGINDVIDVSIRFNKQVVVKETKSMNVMLPALKMNTGNYAYYEEGNLTDTLTFMYQVKLKDIVNSFDVFYNPSNISENPLQLCSGSECTYIRQNTNTPETDATFIFPIPAFPGSLSSNVTLKINTTYPAVEYVSFYAPSPGVYGVGEEIEILVTFNGPVYVFGYPWIDLNNGGKAYYHSGLSTTDLIFIYSVNPSDANTDSYLDLLNIVEYGRKTASIEETMLDFFVFGTTGLTTEPPLSEYGIAVITDAPKVTNVSCSRDEVTLGMGDELIIFVNFDAPLLLQGEGVPQLILDVGDFDQACNFTSLSNDRSTLIFKYTVEYLHSASCLDYADQHSLILPESTYLYRYSTNPSQDAVLTLPRNGELESLGMSCHISVNTTVPIITGISSYLTEGSYGVGTTIQILELIWDAGKSLTGGSFALRYGPSKASQCISLVSLSDTVSLKNGIESINSLLSVNVVTTESVNESSARFQITFISPATGVHELWWDEDTNCSDFICDGSPCLAASIIMNRENPNANRLGIIEILLHASHDVRVFGEPTISVKLENRSNCTATWVPGSIQYIDVGVYAASSVADGYFRILYGNIETGCIRFQSADSTINVDSLKLRLEEIDHAAMIGIVNVGKDRKGNGFQFSITFASPLAEQLGVPVSPTSCANSLSNDAAVTVHYPNVMSFLYIPEYLDVANELIVGSGDIELNGGKIVQSSEYYLQEINYKLPTSEYLRTIHGITIDCSPQPVIESISLNTFGETYASGDKIHFTIVMDSEVAIRGSPFFYLNSGSSTKSARAVFVESEGEKTLSFQYIVSDGESTSKLAPYSIYAFVTNDGSIVKKNSTGIIYADLKLPSSVQINNTNSLPVKINTDVPSIKSIILKKEGYTYGVGEEILLTLQYDKPVRVVGDPFIPLNSNGKAKFTKRALVQVIDVVEDVGDEGMRFSSNVTAGSFRLSYKGESTDCIEISSKESMYSELASLPSIKELFESGGPNLTSVSIQNYMGGYRFDVPWNWYESCDRMDPPLAKPQLGDTTNVSFMYIVEEGEKTPSTPLNFIPEMKVIICCDQNSYIRRASMTPSTDANLGLPTSLPTSIFIDTTPPKIISVDPYSNGVFGVDEKIIIIMTLDQPVCILEDPDIYLILQLKQKLPTENAPEKEIHAEYTNGYSAGTNKGNLILDTPIDNRIILEYIVGADDYSYNLDYANSTAMFGSIYRLSSNPTSVADLSLPPPGSSGSLAFDSYVVVMAAFQRTKVKNVFSIPLTGAAVIGDEIEIVVKFTRPFRVISSGNCQLEIDVGTLYLLNATLATSQPASDEIRFLYIVKPLHSSEHLGYFSSSSFRLMDGAVIVDDYFHFLDTSLPHPRTPRSLRGTSNVEILTKYYIVAVDSLNPNGIYHAGDSVLIRVTFSSSVVVLGIPLMMIQIGPDADHHARAEYYSGSGSPELIFRYNVSYGDRSIRLGYDGQNAISLPTYAEAKARIVCLGDFSTDADLNMPEAWSNNQLGITSHIEIDAHIPEVIKVTTDTPDGTYGVGEAILVKVTFSYRIWVKSSGQLPFLYVVGNRKAVYAGGNTTDTLEFVYNVVDGDYSPLFDYLDTSTSKNQNFSYALTKPSGSEIKAYSARPLVDALLILPKPGNSGTISAEKVISINTNRPSVYAVTVSSHQSVYSIYDKINITVQFTDPVTFYGKGVSPSLLLNTKLRSKLGVKEGENRATYASGNGTNMLHLQYVVRPGDYTPLLDYIGTDSLSLYATKMASIQNSDGKARRTATNLLQDANLTLAVPGPAVSVTGPFSIEGSGSIVAIQTRNVKAVKISSPSQDGVYPLGSILTFLIHFSTPVEVTSQQNTAYLPALMLNMDIGDAPAFYVSGSGSNVLTFQYTVRQGDSSPRLDYCNYNDGRSPIRVFNNSIAEFETGEPVYLNSLPLAGSVGSLSVEKNLVIDGKWIYVSYVKSDLESGTYGAGQKILIRIYFIMPLEVDPPLSARLITNLLNSAGRSIEMYQTRLLNDMMGIEFEYIVKTGDHLPENLMLEYSSENALSANLYFSAGYSRNLVTSMLPLPFTEKSISGSNSIYVDTSKPFVTSVTSWMHNGMYPLNSVIEISVIFSAPVIFLSDTDAISSRLILDVSDTIGSAAMYAHGSGTCELVYKYIVLASHGSSDLDVSNSISLQASNLKRKSTYPTTDALVELPVPGKEGSLSANKDIIINPDSTKVVSVICLNSDGVYGVGEDIWVQINFSSNVMVLDAEEKPYIELNAGNGATAKYFDGNGTENLVFRYVVEEGHETQGLNYTSINSLISLEKLFSKTYSYGPIVPLAMQLPEYGSVENMGYSYHLIIDTRKPTVVLVTSPNQNGIYGTGEEIIVSTFFSAPVVLGQGLLALYVDVGIKNGPLPCYFNDGNTTEELSWKCTIREGDSSSDLCLDTSNGQYAFRNGILLRNAAIPVQEASLLTPIEGSRNSLSGNKDIRVETSQPKVVAVASRRTGVISAGQMVDFQVIFDSPVIVSGSPTLAFPLDDGSIRMASFKEDFYTYVGPTEIPFINSKNVLSFTYIVQPEDKAEHLTYYDSDSLSLNGGSIKRYGLNPTTDAVLSLPSPQQKQINRDSELLDTVYKVEVYIHGLSHIYVPDLEISLHHDSLSATLVRGISSLSDRNNEIYFVKRVGYDIAAYDVCGPNIVHEKRESTLQSSTIYEGAASRATDKITDGIFSNGGTTLTNYEESPWWQVQLVEEYPIGHIRIFGPQADSGSPEIQLIEILGYGDMEGYFYLTFGDIRHGNITSDRIYIFAPCSVEDETSDFAGSSIEAILKKAVIRAGFSSWLSITVHRCTNVLLYKYRRSFTVSIKSSFGDIFPMQVSIASVFNGFEARIHTIHDGTLAGPVYYNGSLQEVDVKFFPLWLFIFNSSSYTHENMTIDEAIQLSVFNKFIRQHDFRELNVPLPKTVMGTFIRLQLAEPGQLSIAEVEAYSIPFKHLSSQHSQSSSLYTFSYRPILPLVSPTHVFSGSRLHGDWTLTIKNKKKSGNSSGIVGGWSLTLYDYFGNAKTYSSDAWVSVVMLPRFGTLHTSPSGSAIQPFDHRTVEQKTCSANSNNCASNAFSSKSTPAEYNRLWRKHGEAAIRLYYKPHTNFTGTDSFLYTASSQGRTSSGPTALFQIHVTQCRLKEFRVEHLLCPCYAPIDPTMLEQCVENIAATCGNLESQQLPRSSMERLCSSCILSDLSTLSQNHEDLSAECLSEVYKFSAELHRKHYCVSNGEEIPVCLAESPIS